jgi:hypothetical protein
MAKRDHAKQLVALDNFICEGGNATLDELLLKYPKLAPSEIQSAFQVAEADLDQSKKQQEKEDNKEPELDVNEANDE